MEEVKKNSLIHLGAVAAAFGASLCCVLPVAVAILGVGSAALGAQLEPFRPYFLVLTAGLLGLAFWQAYRPRECEEGEACAVAPKRRRFRIALWVVTLIVIVLVTFPYYSGSLF